MFEVYVIQNTINDKVYIGQTSQGTRRLQQHRSLLKNGSHLNKHLQTAWAKYSAIAFEFYTLASYETREEVGAAEALFVAWYKELGLIYNQTSGGHQGYD